MISGDSQICPGDVFHPDFSDGHPTYFDPLVQHTLQPNTINEASRTAGIAAAEGETIKDDKYAETVARSKAVFVPLIVETLKVWTPFARSTLRSIASRATIKNGLSKHMAYKNLILSSSLISMQRCY